MDPFEKDLRQLTPRDASPSLRERLAAELDEQPGRNPEILLPFQCSWRYAAAAVVLLALGLAAYRLTVQNGGQPAVQTVSPPPPPAGVYHPVAAERHLVRQDDEGILVLNGYGPVRKTRYQTIDHMEWRNPRTDARYSVTRPNDQVVFTRLAVY